MLYGEKTLCNKFCIKAFENFSFQILFSITTE